MGGRFSLVPQGCSSRGPHSAGERFTARLLHSSFERMGPRHGNGLYAHSFDLWRDFSGGLILGGGGSIGGNI